MVLHDSDMPKLSSRFQQLRKEADWSTDELAEMLGLAGGSLRNAESGREPMGDRRIHRAARLFAAAVHRPVHYSDLVAETGDGVPETPPEQPKPKPKPEKRKERGGTGPRRDQRVRGAA
jgi:transcriptional regulator with XRE-family HTH domain